MDGGRQVTIRWPEGDQEVTSRRGGSDGHGGREGVHLLALEDK